MSACLISSACFGAEQDNAWRVRMDVCFVNHRFSLGPTVIIEQRWVCEQELTRAGNSEIECSQRFELLMVVKHM